MTIIKYFYYSIIILLFSCNAQCDDIQCNCSPCDADSIFINEGCTAVSLFNVSKDSIWLSSIDSIAPNSYQQRRFKEGQVPNPSMAHAGCQFKKPKFSILIAPKQTYEFKSGDIMSPTRKYDRVEFEIKYLKNNEEHSQWIGCK